MAKDSRQDFVDKYRPVAERVGKELGVSPNVLLSQWALESNWGKAQPGENNIAGIKDFTGRGTEAVDNQLGTKAKYVDFADPETFGTYYAYMIKNNFPNAVNAGSDISAFTKGLVQGKYGAYFDIKRKDAPQNYAVGLTAIHNSIPGTEAAPRPVIEAPQSSDLVNVPPSAPKTPDTSNAPEGERRLLGGAGAIVGAGSLGLQKRQELKDAKAIRQAALEEEARQRVRRAMQPPPSAPTTPTPSGLNVEPTSAQTTRILQGTTGDAGTTGRARMAGFAAETSQASAAQKQAYEAAQRLRNLGLVSETAPEFFARQPGFTSTPSGVLTPRSTPAPTLGPRGPEGQIGATRTPQIPTQLAGPAALGIEPPAFGSGTKSGLDKVNELFKGMMKPVASAAGTVMKYAAPPVGGAMAGMDIADILHEYNKPPSERDYTKMLLKGAGVVGGGLSMVPGAQMIGIPLSLGSTAIQAYRDDPEMLERLLKRLRDQETADMTGYDAP